MPGKKKRQVSSDSESESDSESTVTTSPSESETESSSEEYEENSRNKKGKNVKQAKKGGSDDDDDYEEDEDDVRHDKEFLKKISLDDLPEPERIKFLGNHEKWIKSAMEEKIYVTLSEPYKDGNFLKSYITYLISTSPWNTNIRRRFSDIEWLHDALSSRYPGILLDPMPSKKILNNQDPEFIDVRMKALERHINKMLENPYLRKDNLVSDFLTLPPKDFDELKKNNMKSTEINMNALTGLFFNESSPNSLVKSKLQVKDKRPNEGYKQWVEYLRHLPAPVEIEKTLKAFTGKVRESIHLLTNVISTLEQMVLRGTAYSSITKQFKENMENVIKVNRETDLISLQTFEQTRTNHQQFINEMIHLEKSSRAWHELEFFQPQEVFPELMYEFQEQLEHLNGLNSLINRRNAVLDGFTQMWKQKDEKQYQLSKAKASRNRPQIKKVKNELESYEFEIKLNKFELQQITKSLIFCEFDKFIEYRAKTFHKTLATFSRLQIVSSQRAQSTWTDLLHSIGEDDKPDSFYEEQKRLANCCTVFEFEEPSSRSESDSDSVSVSSSSSGSHRGRSKSRSRSPKKNKKSNPNDIDL